MDFVDSETSLDTWHKYLISVAKNNYLEKISCFLVEMSTCVKVIFVCVNIQGHYNTTM